MGVNVKGAELVIHMGPSSALDDYLQECGRVGRDSNSTAHAVLLKYSGSTRSKNITKPIKECVAVRSDLLSYRAQLANNISHDKLLTGLDLATGFSRGLIEKIVAEIKVIDSLETLVQQFSFFCDDHAKATWEIISHCIAESDCGSDESINDDASSDG
ncbi:Hypothetical predicted protein [Paramuricea clavata]|uniref:Uncharacterized protein n=1 Tax=Paramuricea clavata TaxID=317549 RepID=A0A7D9IPJ2_PARCT|nr:Hypothetical predicted protein [Paramuricea clavata]